MRIQNEQSGSSSLFAQPIALEPVPEAVDSDQWSVDRGLESAVTHEGAEAPLKVPRTMLEARMEAVLAELEKDHEAPSTTVRQGHLALLKRWYYRPEVKREGEISFADAKGRWAIKSLLRSAGRIAAKKLAPARQQ
jgi:hypothetical protein